MSITLEFTLFLDRNKKNYGLEKHLKRLLSDTEVVADEMPFTISEIIYRETPDESQDKFGWKYYYEGDKRHTIKDFLQLNAFLKKSFEDKIDFDFSTIYPLTFKTLLNSPWYAINFQIYAYRGHNGIANIEYISKWIKDFLQVTKPCFVLTATDEEPLNIISREGNYFDIQEKYINGIQEIWIDSTVIAPEMVKGIPSDTKSVKKNGIYDVYIYQQTGVSCAEDSFSEILTLANLAS